MEIKQITSDFEKYLFLREYNQRANMNVPAEYLFECDVYGAFEGEQMLGGFAFAFGEDMAWPQVLPDSNDFFKSVPKGLCMEINLVWARDELHNSAKNMVKFWLSVTTIASKQKNIEYITYAVDTRLEKLVKMYKTLASNTLYEGAIPKYPGRNAAVFCTTPFRCKHARFLCIGEIVSRIKTSGASSIKLLGQIRPTLIHTKAV